MEQWEGPAVEVGRLTKTYPGGMEAVRGIDFEVAPGEVFGLLGPNGAGKSTTIGMLTSTVLPTSGWARLGGFDVARQPLAARRISSVLFQDPVVDFPAPFGPSRPNTSPSVTENDTPSSACTSPYDFRSSSTTMASIGREPSKGTCVRFT